MEYLINVPDIEKGVPLFYKVIMTFITSNTNEAIFTRTLIVSTFKITSIQGGDVSIAVSQLQGAYRRLMIAEKVPHNIADHLINIFFNTSMDEFNATFKAMKYNIHIENCNCDAYTKMVENGSWNSPATIQDSGFVVNTNCWNCGGKGHKAVEYSSKKVTNTTNTNKTRGNGLLLETGNLK